MRAMMFALLCLLVACTPAASVPTPAPSPTPDLESLLIQSGDLPAGFSGAQVRDQAPNAFRAVTGAVRVIDQRVQRNGDVAGGITVFVFADSAMRDASLAAIRDGLIEPQLIANVGSAAIVDGAYLAVACGPYLVHVHFSGASSADVAGYARRLLRRLMPDGC